MFPRPSCPCDATRGVVTAKPVIPRAKAREDVSLAVEYYADEAGADVAFSFIDALEQAYSFIGEMLAAGSPRWSHALSLPSLRTIGLNGFPWLRSEERRVGKEGVSTFKF